MGPAASVEVLDDHGDLKLIVGEKKVVFQVCSRTLARSSPVWKTLLYGPYSEGKNQQVGESWEIPLPEDDPDALKVVLNTLHQNFEALPKGLPLASLTDIAVICDKYDMVASLKPLWIACRCQHRAPKLSDVHATEVLQYLWLFRTLGDGPGYLKAFSSVVSRARINGHGELCLDDVPLGRGSPHLLPPTVFEQVKQSRQAVLKKLCTRIKEQMDSLVKGRRRCRQKKTCDYAMLGALLRELASRNLEHWYCGRMEGLERTLAYSPKQLVDLLEQIRSRTHFRASPHTKCSIWESADHLQSGLARKIIRILDTEHIKKQAAKTGLDPVVSIFSPWHPNKGTSLSEGVDERFGR